MTTKAVALFKARLMQLPGYLLQSCPQVRLDRAASLVALPTRLGGAGLTPAAVVAPCAYLATVQAVAGEPTLREAHDVLHPHIHFALAALCELLECEDPGNLPPAVLKILPPTPEAILAPLLHAASTTPPRWKKVQGSLTGAVALHRRRTLKALCDDAACPE